MGPILQRGDGQHDGQELTGLRPFLLGTAVGGVAGAIAGTILSRRTQQLLLDLIRLTGRRFTAGDRDEIRFELLLQ